MRKILQRHNYFDILDKLREDNGKKFILEN